MIKIKKLLACAMCTCLLSVNLATPIYAEENTPVYNEFALEHVFDMYDYNVRFLDILKNKESYAFMKVADQYNSDTFLAGATSFASWLVDADLQSEDYIKLLIEIIQLNQVELTEQAQHYQNEYKDVKDFAKDAVDMGFGIINLNCDFFGKSMGKVYKFFDIAHTPIWSIYDLVGLEKETAIYRKLLIDTYISNDSFLSAICNNSDNKNLVLAAKKLIALHDHSFAKQLEIFVDRPDNYVGLGIETFFSNYFAPMTKFMADYASDSETKMILKTASAVTRVTAAGKLAFDACIFLGDSMVGTSDTFKYVQRVRAVDAISRAIISEIESHNPDAFAGSQERYEEIVTSCELYRWLITVTCRGENLVYALLTSPNNEWASLKNGLAEIRGEMTVEEWFEKQKNGLIELYNDYVLPITTVYDKNSSEETWRDAYMSYVVNKNIFGEVQGFLLFDLNGDSIPEVLILRKEHDYATVLSCVDNNVTESELDEYSHTVDGKPGITIDKDDHLLYSQYIAPWYTSDAKIFTLEAGYIQNVMTPVVFALNNAKNYLYEDRIEGTEDALRSALAFWTPDEDMYGTNVEMELIKNNSDSNMDDASYEEDLPSSTRIKYVISGIDSITPVNNGESFMISGQVFASSGEYLDLFIDDATIFDSTCPMQYFNEWNEGDSPVEWYRKNYSASNGSPSLCLLGVFDIEVTGNHIDKFYGIYWWD